MLRTAPSLTTTSIAVNTISDIVMCLKLNSVWYCTVFYVKLNLNIGGCEIMIFYVIYAEYLHPVHYCDSILCCIWHCARNKKIVFEVLIIKLNLLFSVSKKNSFSLCLIDVIKISEYLMLLRSSYSIFLSIYSEAGLIKSFKATIQKMMEKMVTTTTYLRVPIRFILLA